MEEREIKGICCKVENCIYHKSDDCCEAGFIEVGTTDNCPCESECDTACKTFKAKY